MCSYSSLISALAILGCAGCSPGDTPGSPESPDPEFKYKVQHGWPTLPEGHILGLVTAVEIDSHGHVFALQSMVDWEEPYLEQPESEPLVLMWDSEDGALAASWGAGIFLMPHGLSIDENDQVWVVDAGLNQVMQFSHDGELLMTLGENRVEGWDEAHFALPTDVEFAADGSVYVSDGYVNCRVANFTSSGEYQFEWGECGNARGQFNIPHDLAIDSQGRVYVADRENDRVQVFEANGDFIAEWQSAGEWRPYGLSVSATEDKIYVVDGGEQPASFPDRAGVVILDLSGHQVDKFGRFGNQDGQFMMGHDITVGRDGMVYVVDVVGRRLQRFSQSE